jgi:ABC-type transport system substrate-binding protein
MKTTISLIIAISLLVLAYFGYTYWKPADEGNTLSLAVNEFPKTLNPALSQSSIGFILSDLLFDGMTNRTGKKIDEYELGIAEDIIQDPEDKSIFTVKLKKNRQWHDDPNHFVSSTDVIFSYHAILNKGNFSPVRGKINELIKVMEAVDSHTVQIVFSEPVSSMAVKKVLTFKIIPAKYYGKSISPMLLDDAVAREFSQKPVGSGPFKFQERSGSEISLVAVNKEEKKIHQVKIKLVNDLEKQTKMFIDGQIDLLLDSDSDFYQKLDGLINSKSLAASYIDYTPYHFYAIAYNNKAFIEKARKAFSMAVDKNALVNRVLPGDNPDKYINKGPFPVNADYRYSQFLKEVNYEPKIAEKNLAALEISTASLYYSESLGKVGERMAGELAKMFANVGVEVKVGGIGQAFDTFLTDGSYEMALVRHSDFSKHYNISPLYYSDSPKNITGIVDKDLDILLKRWENTAFWLERLPVSEEIHNKLVELAPYTYLCTLPSRVYYSNKFGNVSIKDPGALLGNLEQWIVN